MNGSDHPVPMTEEEDDETLAAINRGVQEVEHVFGTSIHPDVRESPSESRPLEQRAFQIVDFG